MKEEMEREEWRRAKKVGEREEVGEKEREEWRS